MWRNVGGESQGTFVVECLVLVHSFLFVHGADVSFGGVFSCITDANLPLCLILAFSAKMCGQHMPAVRCQETGNSEEGKK